MAKPKRYDDNTRAGAVVMLQSQGYPNTPGALRRVSEHLGIPESTLSRWARGVSNPPPSSVVSEKRQALDTRLEALAHKILDRVESDDVLDTMSGRELMTAFGIGIDKMRLLRDLPTEIVGVAPQLSRLMELMQTHGHDFEVFINRAIARYEDSHAVRH